MASGRLELDLNCEENFQKQALGERLAGGVFFWDLV